MAQFSVEELQTLQNWMLDKGVNKCPICGSEDGFTNVVEVGQANTGTPLPDGSREGGYMEERFGEVEAIMLPSGSLSSIASREHARFFNSLQGRVDERNVFDAVKQLWRVVEVFRG